MTDAHAVPAPRTTGGLLTFGETMGLIVATAIGTLEHARDFTFGIGGAESNVAIGVARLGAPATWIGRVGSDAAGDLVGRRLRAEGVRAVAVRDPSFTGLMIRHQRAAGVVHVDYHRAGSAGSRLTSDDLPVDAVRQAAILHLSGITPALSASARHATRYAVAAARAHGVLVSVDVNYRGKLWDRDTARRELRGLVTEADIVFAGVEEAQLVLGSHATAPERLAMDLAALGPAEAVVKTGSRGCTARLDGVTHTEPALSVPVVDTVGAGDAFVAGYLAERLGGGGPAQRLRTACAMGAYAVSVPGDCELLPTRDELETFLKAGDVLR
ncbi:sugar kinase [Streptomyces verrucosisporus]|uniref:sugar kinase n=1 Tax=Streptomyces verrucosisporus TaxID=1695161 RepID=UPI0019D117FB|nr:sugar kinase [Streptomyces verrucosisporus]MBN3928258.1 sugar kinase [Streptomyces verrucosisporus]